MKTVRKKRIWFIFRNFKIWKAGKIMPKQTWTELMTTLISPPDVSIPMSLLCFAFPDLTSQAADFLAILHDESRGSYRTVATGCLREARCSLVAIHL